jgi:ABC-type nitrate/sulfonate/bicarbonate transport system ATPase subunit
LLDEPFNNLDFLDRHRVETFLRAWVAEERRAAICVTHDIEQAVAIGDRIGCFTRLPNASSSDPMCFEVLQVPDSLRKHSPSERWGRPEFHGVVEQIEQKFEHG